MTFHYIQTIITNKNINLDIQNIYTTKQITTTPIQVGLGYGT